MNSVIKTFIYMFRRLKSSYIIFTSIFLGILVFVKIMSLLLVNGSQGNNTYDLVFIIYASVYFIAIFKDSFNHLSTSGVTRKTFFVSNIISIIFTALILEITAIIFSGLTQLMGTHTEFIIAMIYKGSNFELFILGLSFAILASFVGWLFSLLTYRFGNYMILVIIFVPQILMTVFGAVIQYLGKTQDFLYLAAYYFGLTNGQSVYSVILHMLLTAVAVGAINWLLMRRLPVKV